MTAEAGYRVLPAADAFWRPSNATGVLNTDLGAQLEAETLGARLWRLNRRRRPGGEPASVPVAVLSCAA